MLVFIYTKSIYIPLSSHKTSPVSSQLTWVRELNKFQKGNTCGAHSIMVVTYFSNKTIVNPYEVNSSITNRSSSGGLLPWSIKDYLNRNSIKSELSFLSFLSDKQKINWVKHKIAEGKPVIITTNSLLMMHYITIVGYDDHLFYIYDSQNSVDGNGLMAGNTTISEDGLLNSWNKALIGIISLNIAITEKE